MIENSINQNNFPTPESEQTFPLFIRNNISPVVDGGSPLAGTAFAFEFGNICTFDVSTSILEKIKEGGEQTEAQSEHQIPLTPAVNPTNTISAVPAQGSHPSAQGNQNNGNDHQALIHRLSKPPHVIPFHGATLDRNERLKIIAAIAICESGHDPFSAENLDSEFHKMPSANLSYGHIVHIGLSYGIIQFTQDSGSLGKLLTKMRGKDTGKFSEIFGNNSDELITLTTTGISVPGVHYDSGQAYWNTIRHTPFGQQLTSLALHNNLSVSQEIRGRRVQPIAVSVGAARQDLWEGIWKERFTNAGKVDAFQEAELDFAVDGYMNPVLRFCRQHNIRSALGLAFVTACTIRGASKRLLGAAAVAMGEPETFLSGAAEKRALQHIAALSLTANNHLGGFPVQKDEIVRARKLLVDETGFLAEDFYDIDTYGAENDH
jgi:hypothetical protein